MRRIKLIYLENMSDIRFEPLVLKWAREKRFGQKMEALLANWSTAWEPASPELIKQWEDGTVQPNFSQVKKLAEIYKRPLAVFFLNKPPEEPSNPPDLRTIASKDNKFLSPDALLVIRKARRIQEVAKNLREDLGEKVFFKYPKYDTTKNVSVLASKVRSDLEIYPEDQLKPQKYEDFFEYLRGKIEKTGVITIKSGTQDSFPTEDCRAFSFADRLPYLILINNKDNEGAKNFSLMHEFAHILLREAGICNNFKSFSDGKKGVNKVEVFCNQFAASFLVPKEELLNHRLLIDRSSVPPEEVDATIEGIAKSFKVSRYVILRRLLTLNLITGAAYKTKTDAWDEDDRPLKKKGGSFSLKTILLKNGRAFSSLVIESYKQNKIPYASVSDYLGLKTKHLPSFEKLVNPNGK
jgi:Zn-dependent peptidase ImmA (M78 family)